MNMYHINIPNIVTSCVAPWDIDQYVLLKLPSSNPIAKFIKYITFHVNSIWKSVQLTKIKNTCKYEYYTFKWTLGLNGMYEYGQSTDLINRIQRIFHGGEEKNIYMMIPKVVLYG